MRAGRLKSNVSRGLIAGLSVALPVGAMVGFCSVPRIKDAVHGVTGALLGAVVIGLAAGSVGGILAKRWDVSPIISGAWMTALSMIAVTAALVLKFGAGNWPG